MKSIKYSITMLMLATLIVSCVPQRKYLETKQKADDCEALSTSLKKQHAADTIKIKELKTSVGTLSKEIKRLARDTSILSTNLRRLTSQYDKLNDLNNELLRKQNMRSAMDAEEIRGLLADLQKTKDHLLAKEDSLRALAKRLEAQRRSLEDLQTDLQQKDAELTAKNKRLIELEAKLNRQDSIVNALKQKVADALIGFKDAGLDVKIKNGKVYVSLQEKLLFQSGRWDVNPEGKKALKKLAKILEDNKDISIMVEGHTDDLAYRGNGNIEDNWDLSTKRATSIVKYLLSISKIDPKRLAASGRGEFLPVDTAKTKEARAKNRRTEIILTPKLDELFQIMGNN